MLARSTGCKFLEVKPSDLKAGYVGQSGEQVKAIWEKARWYGRCVMFVDECDGVFARRGGTDTDAFADDVVTSFLPEWDGAGSKGQVWVVGATNRRDRFDDAIISRFGTPIEIGLPDAGQRIEILRLEMKKLERDVTVPDFVGPATTGFAGRKLAELAKSVVTLGEKRGGISDDVWREVIGVSAKATRSRCSGASSRARKATGCRSTTIPPSTSGSLGRRWPSSPDRLVHGDALRLRCHSVLCVVRHGPMVAVGVVRVSALLRALGLVFQRRATLKKAVRDAIPRPGQAQPVTADAPPPRAQDREIRI